MSYTIFNFHLEPTGFGYTILFPVFGQCNMALAHAQYMSDKGKQTRNLGPTRTKILSESRKEVGKEKIIMSRPLAETERITRPSQGLRVH